MATGRRLWAAVLFLACARAGDVAEAPLPRMPDLAASNPLAHEQFARAYSRIEATTEASDATRATALGELAMLFDAYEKSEAALTLYDRALTLEPEQPDWIYYRAVILERSGDLSRAIAELRRLSTLEPRDLAARLRLARCLDRSGEGDSAVAVFEQVLELDSGNAEALAYLADRAVGRGDVAEAIRRLEAARPSAPGNRILAFALGRAYLAAGRRDDAEPLLEAASKSSVEPRPRGGVDPRQARLQALRKSPLAHERRGHVALARGDWMVAIAEFRQALILDPERRAVRHNLAASQLRLGRREEAERTLEENLESSPTFVPSAVLLAAIVNEEGATERAHALLARAEAVDPNSNLVLVAKGRIERARNRPGRAAEILEQTVAAYPAFAAAWVELVASYLQAGRSAQAAKALEQFASALPDHAGVEPLSWRRMALVGSRSDCRREVETAGHYPRQPGSRQLGSRQLGSRQLGPPQPGPPQEVSELESWALLLACAGRWERAIEIQSTVVDTLDAGSAAGRLARERLDRLRTRRDAGPVWLATESWAAQPVLAREAAEAS